MSGIFRNPARVEGLRVAAEAAKAAGHEQAADGIEKEAVKEEQKPNPWWAIGSGLAVAVGTLLDGVATAWIAWFKG